MTDRDARELAATAALAVVEQYHKRTGRGLMADEIDALTGRLAGVLGDFFAGVEFSAKAAATGLPLDPDALYLCDVCAAIYTGWYRIENGIRDCQRCSKGVLRELDTSQESADAGAEP